MMSASELPADALIIELEAEYEEVTDDQITECEEVTGIHLRQDA
jgi:hypothetical protein